MEDKRGAYCRCFLALVLAWAGVGRMLGFAQTAETSDKSVQSRLSDTPAAGLTKTQPGTHARILGSYGKLPLSFEANQGQTDPHVKFLSRGSGYTLFLTPTDAVLAFRKPIPSNNHAGKKGSAVPPAAKESISSNDVLRLKLVGANPKPVVAGAEELPGKSNYFIGNDPKKWRTNVPNYAKVRYESIYPGIDLVYYGNQGKLEYDFVVAPGADPGAIGLRFAGAARVQTDAKTGALLLQTGKNSVRFKKPLVYQTDGPRTTDRALVEGRYKLIGRNQVAFEMGSYDRTKPLVIDPTLSYSTFLGGSDLDYGRGIAVDASGNAYLAGSTCSSDFPTTPGAFQGKSAGGTCNTGGVDAFVTKLNTTGSALAYSTYLGGSSTDGAESVAVDGSGDAYVTGFTCSSDFPTTPGAFQTVYGGGNCVYGDAFVTKFNSTGSALAYSIYLGGSAADVGFGVVVDALGDAYATGYASAGFPITPAAFQTNCGYVCAFVTKLNPTGSGLVYSSFLAGSTGLNIASGLALDASGDAYVTGYTGALDFPVTPGAFQTQCGCSGGADAFITEFNSTGSALIFSTYLGGSSQDQGEGIAVDSSGSAYVTGYTSSSDFPVTPGVFEQSCIGGSCANGLGFVTKLNVAGSALVYSSYLGGGYGDSAQDIALDAQDDAYVTGYTSSSNFPIVPGAYQTTWRGSTDAFLTEISTTGSSLVYSTFFGGSSSDYGWGVAVDAPGNVYLAGYTFSSDFPVTPGAFQSVCGGCVSSDDSFVAKFLAGPEILAQSLNFGIQTVGITSTPLTATFTNSTGMAATITSIGFTGANSGDFAQTNTCGSSVAAGASCTINVTFTPTASGIRTGTLTIADNSANSPQSVSLTGTGVLPATTFSPTSLTFPTQVVFTSSKVQTVTLTNTGTGSLTISSIAATGQFSQTNTYGTSVAPGASCAIGVTFRPKSKGTLTGTVTVTDNAPGSPQKVTLSGCGTYIQFSTPTLTFGNQPVGTKSPAKKVTVTNKGSAAVSITSISIGGSNAGDFAETNTCGSSLASGANCSFSVTFTPAKQGKRSGEIAINDNGGCSPQMVAVTGTGTP